MFIFGNNFWKVIHSNITNGTLYFYSKEYNEAIRCFTKAIEVIKSYIRIKQKKIDNAPQSKLPPRIKYLHELYVKLLLKRGYVYQQTKKKEIAANDYKIALDYARGYLKSKGSVFFCLSKMLYEFKLYEKSLEVCCEGLRKDKNDYWLYTYKICNNVMLNKEKKSSLVCLKTLCMLNSKGRYDGDPNYFSVIGAAKRKLKEYEEAIKSYNQAIRLDGNNPGYFFARGWALEKLKQYGAAIKNYKQAIKLNPNKPDYFHGMDIA